MPKIPRGEKRPTDVIGAAVKVMPIAPGEETEELPEVGKEHARKGGNGCALRALVQLRSHKTPAMAAGIEKRLWSMEDVVALIDARDAMRAGTLQVG
jgi:hypothetical protein